ncbi:DUF485 domain-containing protein [Brevibacillus humidisoli]|uniref:DUF485 domain-containing protein n=1 Tax=Brevibacillus humidisoli TaxID=2895522 RepID=UPI001E3AE860|nr:DUF485 domain-containing protein [Brevibacillus humidisoli]UFJ38889.1 DUF485 domain-containing protein [Brevibacillus humidisoli]
MPLPREKLQDRMDGLAFGELLRKKKRFIIPTTLFFLVFYYMLPILTAYTDLLDGKAVGPINWAYLYAFAQFVMTWTICLLYVKKARTFDRLTEQVKQEMMRAPAERE